MHTPTHLRSPCLDPLQRGQGGAGPLSHSSNAQKQVRQGNESVSQLAMALRQCSGLTSHDVVENVVANVADFAGCDGEAWCRV